MKQLYYIFLLSLFIAGAFFPPVWVLLIFLATLDQDSRTKEHNDSVEPYVPPTNHTVEDLNIYKPFKAAYLKSPKWNTLRKAILKRDNYTCQSCGVSGVPLDVHHITYSRLLNEHPSDLVSVCRNCHKSIHDRLGYDYNTTFPVSEL